MAKLKLAGLALAGLGTVVVALPGTRRVLFEVVRAAGLIIEDMRRVLESDWRRKRGIQEAVEALRT
jgi:hypothetical protein